MSDEFRISDQPREDEGGAGRPRTVHYNPSDPGSPGPQTRPSASEGLRLDTGEKAPAPSDNRRLPVVAPDTPSSVSSDEAETYLGAPSVASSASEFTDKDLDTANLGVMLQDRYRLQRVLGKGGFGVVYLAHDRVLDQDVAIKVLKLGAANESYKKRFIFEARTAAKLRHMAIVNVFDIVQTEGGLQLVMEYYPGGTMADLIKREGKIEPKEALGYLRQIALGLAFAHKKGIIHRDIKPANIFFANDETVKLGDFGICASYENHDHTMTGEVIGTPLYMAPEQQKDSKDVDPRADVYALGMTLYHMVVGRPPRVVNLDEVHPRLRPLIQQATAYERKERPASCPQLVAMIDQIVKTWDQADDAMRGSETVRQGGGDGTAESELAGTGGAATGGESVESGGRGSVSTRTSEPIPATGASGWDPGEATQTQMRRPGGETTTTTVVQAPGNSWSMVALVGVIIAGFLAVIFMLVGRETPEPTRLAGGGAVSAAAPEVAGAPVAAGTGVGTAEDAEGPDGAAASAGTESAVRVEAPEESMDGGAGPPVEEAAAEAGSATGDGGTEGSGGTAAAPGAATAWAPTQPEWADDDAAGQARSIEDFLASQAGGDAVAFTRDTFLILGDWIAGRDQPSAMLLRGTAIERLRQAGERFPEEAIFPYLLGRLHEAEGQEDAALEQFEQVREIDPAFVAEFDRVILDYLKEVDPGRKLSQEVRSFLLTPSAVAGRTP